MTQPIQEPSTQRALTQGRWGENQLFRRPAPINAAVNECAGFFGWEPQSTATVVPDTWTDIGVMGGALMSYVSTQNNSNYSVNFNTYTISWTASIVVRVMAQIRFSSSFTAGDVIGVRIEFGGAGGATDVVNLHTVPTGSPALSNYYFDCNAVNFAASTNVSLFVYQDSSSNKTFESADLSVFTLAFEDELDVIFT